jgi:cyclopropane fatty-acyl-phospholipid synthase-like methyltransferase
MNFFELLSIGDGDIEILSPITEKRILEIGEYLELSPKKRIIDFGCGKGELLRL